MMMTIYITKNSLHLETGFSFYRFLQYTYIQTTATPTVLPMGHMTWSKKYL